MDSGISIFDSLVETSIHISSHNKAPPVDSWPFPVSIPGASFDTAMGIRKGRPCHSGEPAQVRIDCCLKRQCLFFS